VPPSGVDLSSALVIFDRATPPGPEGPRSIIWHARLAADETKPLALSVRRDRLGRRSKRLISHRRVAPHHSVHRRVLLL